MEMWKSLHSAPLRSAIPTFPQPQELSLFEGRRPTGAPQAATTTRLRTTSNGGPDPVFLVVADRYF